MKTITIGVVGALVAGLLAATPYVLGQRIEADFRDAVARAEVEVGMPIEITAYDRGWLSSTARTTARVTTESGDTKPLVLDHDIAHGSLSELSYAVVNTTFQPRRGQLYGALRPFFDTPALTARTRFPVGGGFETELHSPTAQGWFRDEEQRFDVEWLGLNGTIRGGDSSAPPRVHLDVPGVAVRPDTGGSVRLGDISMDSGPRANEGATNSPWNAYANIDVDTVAATTPDGREIMHMGAHMRMDSTVVEDRHVNLQADYRIDDLKWVDVINDGVPPVRIDTARLRIALSGLNRQAMDRLDARLQDYEDRLRNSAARTSDAADRQNIRFFKEALPMILADTPEIQIEVPEIQTSQGRLGGGISAVLSPRVGGPSDDDALMHDLGERATVKAHAFVDEALFTWMTRLSDDTRQTRRVVAGLVEQGFLRFESGRLMFRTTVDAKTISVNGQRLPPALDRAIRQSFLQSLAEDGAA